MKVYRLEVMVIDHDNLGPRGIKEAMEQVRYPNACIAPEVMAVDSQNIGRWRDTHPLNRRDTMAAEFRRLFPQAAEFGCHKDGGED